jgi:glutamine amidotransferase
MIGIVDYGAGNLASVENAFRHLGYDTLRCKEPGDLFCCERVVLPGVGSFSAAMKELRTGGWVDAICNFANGGRPLLGICLGMQLLFERGEEQGPSDGLGLIQGEVVRLSPAWPTKVPHVGWNSLVDVSQHGLLLGVKPNVDVYFVHSFHCVPKSATDVIARCDFGEMFVAAVARGNVAGMQYHPEKSQPAGMRMLENFANWDGKC